MVTLPHFFDQPLISDLLVEAGAAVRLTNSKRTIYMNGIIPEQISYQKQEFDSEKVFEVFTEVMTNQKYKDGINKLYL